MDALSELLRVVKLSGALFYKSRCTAPWCLDAPKSTFFAPYVAPHATHIIEFHHISEGRAYVRVGEETTPLEAGDVVMIPHGDAHQMGNGVGGKAIDDHAVIPTGFQPWLEDGQEQSETWFTYQQYEYWADGMADYAPIQGATYEITRWFERQGQDLVAYCAKRGTGNDSSMHRAMVHVPGYFAPR